MATWAHHVATTSTLNVTTYASAAFTPVAGQLLVVFVNASGTTVDPAAVTASANGITFTQVGAAALSAASANRHYVFVADQLVPASPASMTVTYDCTADAATGAVVSVGALTGMQRVGLTAVRQSTKEDNNAGASTPAPVFASSCLTGNPTAVTLGTNGSGGTTEPSGWTERADVTYGTPTTGGGYVTRDSGFTGTTITWGSTATANGDVAVEFDASAHPAFPGVLVAPHLAVIRAATR